MPTKKVVAQKQMSAKSYNKPSFVKSCSNHLDQDSMQMPAYDPSNQIPDEISLLKSNILMVSALVSTLTARLSDVLDPIVDDSSVSEEDADVSESRVLYRIREMNAEVVTQISSVRSLLEHLQL